MPKKASGAATYSVLIMILSLTPPSVATWLGLLTTAARYVPS